MKSKTPHQLALAIREKHTHGGRRPGAGRKRGSRPRAAHRRRAELFWEHPLHITVPLLDHVWNLRSRRGIAEVFAALLVYARKHFTRIISYAVLRNHIHLIVETRGRAGPRARDARLLLAPGEEAQPEMERTGPVLRDRYHVEVLDSPTKARNALIYVAKNAIKHERETGRVVVFPFSDPSTSMGPWFEGLPFSAVGTGPVLETEPETWLLTRGWTRASPTHRSA